MYVLYYEVDVATFAIKATRLKTNYGTNPRNSASEQNKSAFHYSNHARLSIAKKEYASSHLVYCMLLYREISPGYSFLNFVAARNKYPSVGVSGVAYY